MKNITNISIENVELKAETMAMILKNSPIMFYIKDKNLNYITGTDFSLDFVNYGYDNYAKSNPQIDMKKSEKITYEEDMYVITNKKSLTKEKMALDMEGKPHWYRIYKTPIISTTKECEGLITIVKNIDEAKQYEQQKELFMLALSHDLKNPIKGQIDVLQMLLNEKFGKLNSEQKEIIETILESEIYMENVLLSLLTAYKNNANGIEINKKSIGLKDFLMQSTKDYDFLAKNKKITININVDENIEINIDTVQMRRVISNIIINSIDYSYSNTDININSTEDKYNTIITIENFSPEIPQELLDNLFKDLFSAAYNHKKVGFGLGLFLSKQIVDAHNGKIYLESIKGNNKFFIEIPKK